MPRIATGTKPPAGHTVTLKRSTSDPGAPQEIEYFTTDGTWVCPRTVNGYYYTAESDDEIKNKFLEEFGVSI